MHGESNVWWWGRAVDAREPRSALPSRKLATATGQDCHVCDLAIAAVADREGIVEPTSLGAEPSLEPCTSSLHCLEPSTASRWIRSLTTCRLSAGAGIYAELIVCSRAAPNFSSS